MNPRTIFPAPCLCLARTATLLGLVTIALSARDVAAQPLTLEAGQAQAIQTLSPGDNPEGIALDGAGNIYFGNRHFDVSGRVSRIMKIDTEGTLSELANLGSSAVGTEGILGLATDPQGDVYAALVTFDFANTHGVWHINAKTGAKQRLPGSMAILFPNALTFDGEGNLYCTDSFQGKVWRFRKSPLTNAAEDWAFHQLLTPIGEHPVLPPVGANGIAFFPDATSSPEAAVGHLYVANTQRGLLARVPILTNGNAGGVQLVAQTLQLSSIDGIAMASDGSVYGVIPGARVLPFLPGVPPEFNPWFGLDMSSIVRVDPNAAAGSRVSLVPTDDSKYDFPLSLAFGRGLRDQRSVFVTSSDLLPNLPLTGPAILQAGVGATGYKK